MKRDPKVVSFNRSAAYVHQRAMKNRRDNNPLDALELMRHAVEHSPENRDYRLDLAEMYCEMGCHEQSNRILLDMIAQKDAPAECYYGLALNQLGRNEMRSARRALNLYRKYAGDGEYLEDAENLSAEIEYLEEMKRPVSRRIGRAIRLANRACDALKDDDPVTACRRFEASFARFPEQPEMRALYAMALRLSGRFPEAVRIARACGEDGNASVRTLCMASQVLWLCSEKEEARSFARRAIELQPADIELRLLIFALGELEMHAEASEAIRRALQEAPHDKQLLHMRAVAMHRAGAADGDVEPFWRRILRIEPQDSVARFYCETAAKGELDKYKIEYAYEVPADEFRRRLTRIAEALAEGLESAVEKWKESRDFREIVYWAATSGDEESGRAAMMILASADDPQAESAVREILYRGDVPMPVKIHGVLFLRMRGAEIERFLPPDADARDGVLPEADALLAGIPVCERQLVRFADEVLEYDYGISALSALTLMWRAYRLLTKEDNDVLVRTQEAAAALAWNYLLQHGRRVSVRELAKKFECRPRRMVYYARHMAAVLEGQTAEKDGNTDEDH